MNIQNNSETIKTTVFNLIILDESGSMSGITDQTVSGCNEVLSSIRAAQKENGEQARNLASIVTFKSLANNRIRYVIKNEDIDTVTDIVAGKDYYPNGCTPLLDAVGSTLTDLMMVAKTHEDANAIITIITDGMENSSRIYDFAKVANLISQAKELGWTINLIGANIDEIVMAQRMNINKENVMKWESTGAGSKRMFDEVSFCIRKGAERAKKEADLTVKQRIALRKSSSKEFLKGDNTSEGFEK